MSRKIETITSRFAEPEKITDPKAAWTEQAQSGKYQYLLAHAEDGVIWGKLEDGRFLLSSDAYPEVSPKLRVDTLRELRLFGKEAEWLLWRTESGWQARLILDGEGAPVEYFDESSILWGTDAIGQAHAPFSLVTEADTGIRHAPPMEFHGRHSMRLVVRHYLGYDEQNSVFIKSSRLVNLENGGKQ
jgi:CRISPR-associated protein (TIGR03984 family)